MSLIDEVKNLSDAFFEEVRSYRRHLHQHPELSFEEYNTSKYIAERLEKEGVEHELDWCKTGIVATIKGVNPDKKTIALRADFDALPIQELNDVSYKSKNDGVMHACGHDVHTSSMLGAVLILNELRESFEGTIKVFFQPGEEKIPGGASVMIKEGLLDKHPVKSIFGQHVQPDIEVGKVGFRLGMYMASADEIYITVKGKGGHGALAHNNIDTVLVASHLIVALQQIVSRRSNATIPTVLSFGKFIANGATNVIPSEVYIEGTFRTFNEEWRAEAHVLIQELCHNLCKSMGAECDIEIRIGYPFLKNDVELTENAILWAKEYMGAENVIDLDMRPTAEDFAYFSQQKPSCFYRLGTANSAKGIKASLHNSRFDIDEEALKTGMGLMAWLAIKELGN